MTDKRGIGHHDLDGYELGPNGEIHKTESSSWLRLIVLHQNFEGKYDSREAHGGLMHEIRFFKSFCEDQMECNVEETTQTGQKD